MRPSVFRDCPERRVDLQGLIDWRRGFVQEHAALTDRLQRLRRAAMPLLIAGPTIVFMTALATGAPFLAVGAPSVAAISATYVVSLARLLLPARLTTAILLVLLLHPGVFLYAAAAHCGKRMAASYAATGDIAPVVGGVLGGGLLFVGLMHFVRRARLRRRLPEIAQIDYACAIAAPLLAELGPGGQATVRLNPRPAAQSRLRIATPEERPGYAFDAWAMLLLDVRVPVQPDLGFRLTIMDFATGKTKLYKRRDKGTKHVVSYRYLLQGAVADAADPVLATSLRSPDHHTPDGFDPPLLSTATPRFDPAPKTVSVRVRRAGNRMVAIQNSKTPRVPDKDDPPPLLRPGVVLANVQALFRAALG